ncbi:DUF3488 and transglutaminase-like domain-containing protein [Ideonella margarita]|uniref:DUF3488 and transglutaminase-like domain-containing protein n=1 Tax=Ideonella margarita TaxID=2984191 RepID=A0ABU9C2A5_9BURK
MANPSSTTRDQRDTWFMLALIGWTELPHLLRISPWVSALCVAVLGWRAWLAWRQAPLPGRATLITVLVLAAGLTVWTERTLVGKDAGVTLLVLLMTLKTLELRARRDALVVFFLGFFLVLTQFLYSQSLLTAVAMTVSVWGWLTALTLAHMPAGRPTLRSVAVLAGKAALWGTPVMVALFLLFPRIGPLWAMPDGGARTGLGGELRLGDITELATDDSIALRLRFPDGVVPRQDQLYLRGPVLSEYDGERWTAQPRMRGAYAEAPAGTQPIRWDMTLEPMRVAWLPMLEATMTRPTSTPPVDDLPDHPDDAGQWRLRAPLANRVRMSGEAWPNLSRDRDLPLLQQRRLVNLPPGQHQRTMAWAAALRNRPGMQEADADTLVREVLSHIRREPYSYTLQPGAARGDAIDDFWLDRRSGFCEHYAVAMVIILRAMDVPARIVTGYQGSDAQPVDGWWVVRQSHAHAWVEYWQAGIGWVRTDPTAAVAPERVQRGQALQAPAGAMAGAFDAMSPGLRGQLRRFFERLDNQWNQSVLGYGRQQQFNLLDALGFEKPDWAALARVLVGLMSVAALAGASWAWLDARRMSPWQRQQTQLRRWLKPLGIEAQVHESPGTLARRVREHHEARHGPQATELASALQAIETARYGGPARRDSTTALWRRVRHASRALGASVKRRP